MDHEIQKKSIVVIGGGTGTHAVLLGLKQYSKTVDIAAIVTMADSGGSTGRLRDEFGYLPVGDARMALVALASDSGQHEELLRKLFLYRFDKGNGLSGHSFGNLLLVALTDLLGSEEAAIRAAGKVLRVQGKVIPVTNQKVDLVATYSDGVQVVGEHEIDEPECRERDNCSITKLSVTPEAEISEKAEQKILGADLIVLGPGDLYTSVLANCVVKGVPDAIRNSGAKVVYVCNLMTKVGQTSGMGSQEHLSEITKYIGKKPDFMIVNSVELPNDLLQKYADDYEFPVEHNYNDDGCTVLTEPILASEAVQTASGDILKRSFIRHDSRQLARVLMNII